MRLNLNVNPNRYNKCFLLSKQKTASYDPRVSYNDLISITGHALCEVWLCHDSHTWYNPFSLADSCHLALIMTEYSG